MGLAASVRNADLDLAEASLVESLRIRRDQLGATHVDTVDSLNNLAGVYLHKGEFHDAVKNYRAVLCRRLQLFGRHHASVAVTARKLGTILDSNLKQVEESLAFFSLAQDISIALEIAAKGNKYDSCLEADEESTRLEI